MILFSIIVPVYNAEKYIENTLHSVINQDESNFEVIAVNDGSTDNSLKIIKKIARNDGRIKVYSQKNKGVSYARNLGLDKAKGRYILFLDSDDELPPHTLSSYYRIFQMENADIIEGNIHISEKQDKYRNKIKVFNHDKAIKYFLNCKTISGYAGGKAYNKNILKNIRFISSISYGEDGIFFLETLLKSHKLVHASFACYKYTIRLNSLSGRGQDYNSHNLEVFKQSENIQASVPQKFKKYNKVFIFELYKSEIEKFADSTPKTQKEYYRSYKRLKSFCDKNVIGVLFTTFNLRVRKDAIGYLIWRINGKNKL
ncbi:glycosyltransferase family 2 protein [Lactobacillus gallinarum]|uniref:glycosyltransferase family 2 protein n=1 Tax=Lactobacillus gallinarum TaxID=52242 RepID=UPI000B3AA134|nr:glycosyltransferase family 2 protein [Lactobacillus gallinarum]OUQ00230.1 hypothetical protein B5E95_06670 [Lactobacillus gallinarum]